MAKKLKKSKNFNPLDPTNANIYLNAIESCIDGLRIDKIMSIVDEWREEIDKLNKPKRRGRPPKNRSK